MTVLFAANEDASFTRSGASTYMSTTGGTYDSNVARGSLLMHVSRHLEGALDSSSSDFWYTSGAYFQDAFTIRLDAALISFFDGAQGVMRMFSTNGIWAIQKWSSGWSTVKTGTFFPVSDVRLRISIHCVLHASTGVFDIYVGDTLWLSYAGDTVGDSGSTTIDTLHLDSPGAADTDARPAVWLTEVIVATTDPRSLRVVTVEPTADGNDTAWAGTFADIDELEINDSDLIDSDTATQVENFVTADMPSVLADYDPLELRVVARAQKGASGPTILQCHVRSNVTNYFSGNKALTTSFAPIIHPFTVDPDTAVAWTNAGIDAAQIGVKSIT